MKDISIYSQAVEKETPSGKPYWVMYVISAKHPLLKIIKLKI